MIVNICRDNTRYSFDLICADEAVNMSSSTQTRSDHMLIGHGTGHTGMHSHEFYVTHITAAGMATTSHYLT